jgi:hypothetical protein
MATLCPLLHNGNHISSIMTSAAYHVFTAVTMITAL